jgi:hypothetical protein
MSVPVPLKPVTANQTYILDIIPRIPPRNRIQAVMFAKALNNFAISILLKVVFLDFLSKSPWMVNMSDHMPPPGSYKSRNGRFLEGIKL